MRPIGIISAIVGVIASDPDPCTILCQFDGPQICTGGSWTVDMSDGSRVCHGYHRIGIERHCYHTEMTRATCPASSPHIKRSEVDAIIAPLPEQEFDETLRVNWITSPGISMRSNLLLLEGRLELVLEYSHQSNLRSNGLRREGGCIDYFEEYSDQSNLASFCAKNAGYIRDAFLRNFHGGRHVGYPQEPRRWSEFVGSNLPTYCPNLLHQFPELVPVVIEQVMYESVSSDRPGPMHGSLEIDGVSRAHAFTDSIKAIMDHDPVALRFHIHRVRFEGETHFGQRVGREFVSVAAEEIFKVPESVYFKDAGEGVIEILPTGELTHFEAIGRFIGLSLAHDVSLGVRFPELYVSMFIGRDVEISLEPEVKARLDLMVKGFQAVVPPIWIGEFITVERLGRTFLGTPLIDVNALIANMRFPSLHDVTRHSSWLSNYLHSLSQQDLRKFTRLLCGRSVGPIGGFGAYRPHMVISFLIFEEKLPQLNGFFSGFTVPMYASERELVEGFNELLSRM
jgi:hypothetical protein